MQIDKYDDEAKSPRQDGESIAVGQTRIAKLMVESCSVCHEADEVIAIQSLDAEYDGVTHEARWCRKCLPKLFDLPYFSK